MLKELGNTRPGVEGRGKRRDGPPKGGSAPACLLAFDLLSSARISVSIRVENGALRFHRSSPTSSAYCCDGPGGPGSACAPKACELGLEGIVSKRASSRYSREQPPMAEVEEPGFPEEQHGEALDKAV